MATAGHVRPESPDEETNEKRKDIVGKKLIEISMMLQEALQKIYEQASDKKTGIRVNDYYSDTSPQAMFAAEKLTNKNHEYVIVRNAVEAHELFIKEATNFPRATAEALEDNTLIRIRAKTRTICFFINIPTYRDPKVMEQIDAIKNLCDEIIKVIRDVLKTRHQSPRERLQTKIKLMQSARSRQRK